LKLNIKTIAKEAGVSTATVSRVLNNYKGVREKTRKKVQKVINNYNYEINSIAKSLKQKKSNTIGIIIGNVLSKFYSIIAKNIEDVASEHGFNTILCNGDDDPEKELKYLKVLRSNRVEGIILTPTGKNSHYVNNLIMTGMKIVLLDRLINGVECDAVLVDNFKGAYIATKHLIDQGYRRIGIINGYLDRTTGQERLRGYKTALSDNNIKIDNKFIKIGDFKKNSGYLLTDELLKSKPDAIFVTNLDMLLGSILFLKEKRINIPGEIGIISFDDTEWGTILDPPITVIQQPVKEIAITAAEILLKKIENNNKSVKPIIHTLNTNLVIRRSCIKG